jgi:hypothetical protein
LRGYLRIAIDTVAAGQLEYVQTFWWKLTSFRGACLRDGSSSYSAYRPPYDISGYVSFCFKSVSVIGKYEDKHEVREKERKRERKKEEIRKSGREGG